MVVGSLTLNVEDKLRFLGEGGGVRTIKPRWLAKGSWHCENLKGVGA